MNGIKRAKETWNARDKNAARNGEDRKITRKSSRIEDGGETSQGGNVARVLRPSFYSLWGIKKQRETKRRVTWSLEQDKENKRKEEERERERDAENREWRRRSKKEAEKDRRYYVVGPLLHRNTSGQTTGRGPACIRHCLAHVRRHAAMFPHVYRATG